MLRTTFRPQDSDDLALNATVGLIEDILPDLDWIMKRIRDHDGALAFPKKLIDVLTYDDSISWAHKYETPNLMKGQVGTLVLGERRVHELARAIKNATSEVIEVHRKKTVIEFYQISQDKSFEPWDNHDDLSLDEFVNLLNHSYDERTQFVTSLTIFLPFVFEYFSLMTHGFLLTDLVARAKAGSDKALCMAVQIDKTVLFDIPYFRKRLKELQLGDDRDMLSKVADSMKGKLIGHKITYRKLWLVFAILDDLGYLNISLSELLSICTRLNVHGGIKDPNTFGKRRADYLLKKGTLGSI